MTPQGPNMLQGMTYQGYGPQANPHRENRRIDPSRISPPANAVLSCGHRPQVEEVANAAAPARRSKNDGPAEVFHGSCLAGDPIA
jgi:hypothetical protein